MSEQRNKYWMPLVISFVLALGMYVGLRIKKMTYIGNTTGGFNKIQEVLGYINAQYVTTPDEDEMSKDVINAIVNNLDPHSNYLTREEVLEIQEHLKGHFDGIGVRFYVESDTILISNILKDGPCEKIGIESGDRIISINDSIVAGIGITSEGVIKLLKGKKDSEVKLGILKIANNQIQDYVVTRGVIPIESIDAAYMLDSITGYIKINRFNGSTFQEFMEIYENLQESNNLKHLVIDVRNNPGGYLNECVKLINQLFDEEKILFVYTKGEKNKKHEYRSTGKPHFAIQNVAVLINESSASASEILAGAIQDNDRGVIVGRRSFGKGLVQQDFPLSDGSSLRLTISKYYTPSGRCIQKDYKGHEDYENMNTRLENGELYSKDSIHIADTTIYKTVRGREVFAGGGIIPDVYIPFDTIRYNNDFFAIRDQIVSFSFKNKYRAKGIFPNTFEAFENFVIPDDLITDFELFCNENDPKINSDYFEDNEIEIINIMKGQFAQLLYEDQHYYQINNKRDEAVLKAIELVNSSDPLSLDVKSEN